MNRFAEPAVISFQQPFHMATEWWLPETFWRSEKLLSKNNFPKNWKILSHCTHF
jgi:hypothetical protein